ncbi:MAG TPA: TIGR03086 family metal-binding protein [Acidimicrobiales bacterium]|nr:TIGR03086 family metal-binding protein [Acidimicrobiales bacterium]
MHVTDLHRRSVEAFLDRLAPLAGPPADRWASATPCPGWDVRALVNHVVVEDLWTVPLMGGATLEEVGDRFEGDVLGDDPLGTARAAAEAAVTAAASGVVAGRTVHLSFGDAPAEEYACQLAADHLVHGWDVAVATGGDPGADAELVEELAAWFADREAAYRGAGVIGDRPPGSGDGDPWHELLRAFGRRPGWPTP